MSRQGMYTCISRLPCQDAPVSPATLNFHGQEAPDICLTKPHTSITCQDISRVPCQDISCLSYQDGLYCCSYCHVEEIPRLFLMTMNR